jgi:GH15 family glucan-1,4-alpha-glucosidase
VTGDRYRPVGDYALLSDCHSVALVSREGSVDSASVFGRLLDDGHGLIRRYRNDDQLAGEEGAFVTCSLWLVECLAHQGRTQEARELFDRVASAAATSACSPRSTTATAGSCSATTPKGLSHLSHIAAAVALARP